MQEWVAGRYRLHEVLGEGGMATVYRAWQTGLERWVALKRCRWQSGEELELFREEARLLASLRHPAVVAVHELVETGSEACLVMELVEGTTLRKTVENTLPGEERSLQWLDQLLEVLQFLHGQDPPIILKDLKPDNLMVEPDGRLRVLDFGIAKRLTPGGGTQLLLKGVGSEHYAPLEQYGQGSTDQRSDFYSLGATLYFMLTGSDPMPAWQRIAQQHAPLDPVGASEGTRQLVQRLTALFPQDRPQDEAGIRQLLRSPQPVTDVHRAPPGQARALQAQLRQRWDLNVAGARLLAWAGERPELLVAGASLVRLDFQKGKTLQTWGNALRPTALAVSEDGQRVALAAGEKGLLAWLPRAGPNKEPRRVPLDVSSCHWLQFAGGRQLLAFSHAAQLATYSFPEGQKLRNFGPQSWWFRIAGHRFEVCCAERRRLAVAASDGALFVWEHGSGQLLWQSHLPQAARALDFSLDRQFLVSAGQDLRVWQAETGQCLVQEKLDQPWQALHCQGRALYGLESRAVVVWDFSNARPRLRLELPGDIRASALSPNGWLACLLEGGRVLVLDFELA